MGNQAQTTAERAIKERKLNVRREYTGPDGFLRDWREERLNYSARALEREAGYARVRYELSPRGQFMTWLRKPGTLRGRFMALFSR